MWADREEDGKFRLPLENEGSLGRVGNLALQQVTYGPLRRVVARGLLRAESVALSPHGVSFTSPPGRPFRRSSASRTEKPRVPILPRALALGRGILAIMTRYLSSPKLLTSY